MISLLIFSSLCFVVVVLFRKKLSKKHLLVAAPVTLVTGVVLDHTLGYYLGMWHYNHHPYLTVSYWSIIPISWGIFGIFTHAVIHVVARIVKQHRRWLLPLASTAAIALVSEVMGAVRSIWTYDAPYWLIVIGWLALIIWIPGVTRLSLLCWEQVNAPKIIGRLIPWLPS